MAERKDWVTVNVSRAMIDEAKRVRAARPGRNGVELDANRWVGDLGAIALREWLKAQGKPHPWLRVTSHMYSPDFKIGGVDVRVRTSQRVRFSPADGIGLNQRHRRHSKKSRYVFAVYNPRDSVVHLVGTMLLGDFLSVAARYESGELLPVGTGAGTLPDGTPLYDVAMTHAQPMRQWLAAPERAPEPDAVQIGLF